MFEALRTTAAIIFAVIGAWLAIIYPERLKVSIRASGSSKAPEETGMSRLFQPVVNSTAILGIILMIGIIAPIARRYPLELNIEVFRGFSYATLVSLTLWQIWTVVLTLDPANAIKSFSDKEDREKKTLDGLTSLAQRRETPPQ